jgi:sugar phosphate isomerase/epimerase
MRLGGFFEKVSPTPEGWAAQVLAAGYGAAYAPFRPAPGAPFPSDGEVADYRAAAERNGIVIAEVGAWGRNGLAEDEREWTRTVEETAALLDLADGLGARCVVNSAGWRSNPDENFSDETLTRVVDTTRRILDLAGPGRAFFTLELVPDVFPNSIESYLDLIAAVDRPRFGVHLDPANLVDNGWKYARSGEFLRHCVRSFGPLIRSCHVKDIVKLPGFPVHFQETRPGLGHLDLGAFLRAATALDRDMPLMLEHLSTDAEYAAAAAHLRSLEAVPG